MHHDFFYKNIIVYILFLFLWFLVLQVGGMNITEFKYRYDSNGKEALVLYRYSDNNFNNLVYVPVYCSQLLFLEP